MKIGIITAITEEFRAAANNLGAASASPLGSCRAGRFASAGNEFLVVESGMGFVNASRAAETLIREWRPDLLITTGFCGGIAPDLQAGDVVVAKNIVIASEKGFEEIPALLSPLGSTIISRQAALGKRIVAGTFVTAAAITSKKRLAAELPGYYHNPVVEMESGAIAIIAAEHNVPLLAIRAVSDTADEELGFSLDEFCDPEMRKISPIKVLLTVLRKPHIIPQLVRLSRSSRTAAESMTAALSRLFSTLQNVSRN